MTSLTLYPNSSTALLSPVDYISLEAKDRMIEGVASWLGSRRLTAQREYVAARDTMLIKWLWHTGMRISDALRVRFDDINNDTETVRFIVSKRSRKKPFIHEITLSKAMMFEVMKFREQWRAVYPRFTERLFPVSRQNMDARLRIYRQFARNSTVSAHKFRHGCAMNMLGQSVPPVEMAYRLAHSNTRVTEAVYARMNVGIEREMLEGVEW